MAIAVLMMMPAAIALASGVEAFEERWVLSDGKIKYQGLSSHGFEMIALAALGVLLGLFYATTILARRAADRMADAPSARTRVFSPDADADAGDAKATTLTGIARRASVEIEAPISGELCLVFGLCGPVGDADVDDADGGDFDLELPSGERVMISLEHARLVPGARGLGPTAGPAVPTKMTAALDEVLTSRGIEDGDGRAFLVEHLLRDGDEVRVTGDVLGGTVTALAYRSGGKSRVLAGDVDRPVAVRIDP